MTVDVITGLKQNPHREDGSNKAIGKKNEGPDDNGIPGRAELWHLNRKMVDTHVKGINAIGHRGIFK